MMYQSSTYHPTAEILHEHNPLLSAVREGNVRLFAILSKQFDFQDVLRLHGAFLIEEARRSYQPLMVSELLKIDVVRESLNTTRVESILHLSESSSCDLPSNHCRKSRFF